MQACESFWSQLLGVLEVQNALAYTLVTKLVSTWEVDSRNRIKTNHTLAGGFHALKS